ncbi:tyrosine-type recombinase/integrase [Chitinimonas koreensis]|uniref:tyrosine-type recombinase/integrase n=1 Tax=Chitinimonas koreensis TaxID=356302 RepID=UPI000684E237|nr:site-specific integrase [Chitinimonas koreensis]QNM96422.1 site-specific integrase [Chitinimonas koreensis]
MATITKRTGKQGAVSYRAQIRIKRGGAVVYSEARTFPRERLAKEWAARVELELVEPGAVERRKAPKLTIGELIEKYVDEVERIQPLGRTKRHVLDMLLGFDIARRVATELVPADLLSHCRERAESGAGPATVAHDVSYLHGVLSYAKRMWGLPLGNVLELYADTTIELKRLGLIGRSRRRDRRPTSIEIGKILEGLRKRQTGPNAFIPHDVIFEFAIYSCMRISEVTALRWDDLDRDKRCVLARERKDPNNKKLNDQVVPLLGPAWDIVASLPVTDDRIFPYDPRSVTAAYQQIRTEAGIVDLRFHDMRHEGISRLFELGYSIEQVAMVSGHKDWKSLKRYTNLRPESLHDRVTKWPTAGCIALPPGKNDRK